MRGTPYGTTAVAQGRTAHRGESGGHEGAREGTAHAGDSASREKSEGGAYYYEH